jgi:hypothetical protein
LPEAERLACAQALGEGKARNVHSARIEKGFLPPSESDPVERAMKLFFDAAARLPKHKRQAALDQLTKLWG